MNPLNPQNRLTPKRIMLATDFSPASEVALPHALTLAHHYGSTLYVAHVVSPEFIDLEPPEAADPKLQEAHQIAQQNMERLLSTASQRGVSCQPLIGEGVIWDVLQGMIQQNGIDLIVVGTHGRGGRRKLVLGSVAEEVFRMAPCPVLTVGPKTSETRPTDVHLGHILYPLEFVPDTSHAAAYAVSLAEDYHTRLTFMKVFEQMVPSPVVNVAVEEPVKRWMDDHIPAESDLRERTNFEPAFGPAAEAICKFAGIAAWT
jgi:nucleotide-binding universal stress UspA family protein